MRKTLAFLLAFALLFLAGCTAPVENIGTPTPTDLPNTQTPIESAAAGDFSFTKDFDLDGDGVAEEIKLLVHSYNEPTLVIGSAELKFANHSDASYDSNPQITVCNVEGGKLIYIVLEGNANFYAHCAYYSDEADEKLTEIAFPFDYENLNAIFPCTWLTDKQIEITCALGGESKVLEIDEEGFKTLSGVEFASYTKTNEFTVGDNNITAINADNGELRLIYLLEFENYWAFAKAELTLKFSAETQTLELSDVNYTVDDYYTWIKD